MKINDIMLDSLVAMPLRFLETSAVGNASVKLKDLVTEAPHQ